MLVDDESDYAYSLLDEVKSHAAASEIDHHLAFSELVLEQLAADGYTEDPMPVYYQELGAEIGGYALSSDRRRLDLFICHYSARADDDYKIDRAGAEAAFKRLERFLNRCLANQIGADGDDTDLTGLSKAVQEVFLVADKIRFVFATNARSVVRDRFVPVTLHGRSVSRDMWDLRRLARWHASGEAAEPIDLEFPQGLKCLEAQTGSPDCAVMLAIIPAVSLAELYREHHARLLERNVRSYLQVRNTVNKGILQTLREAPERFLSYNNGIALTASVVDLGSDEHGSQMIRRIHGVQIVNGGQTTATIEYASRIDGVDLSRAYVQMKLTIVPEEQLDDIVPRISEYSNTQTKVSASDLRANSAFHTDVERAMRTLLAPAVNGRAEDTHWFYERARGQYQNAVSTMPTKPQRDKWKARNPPSQKFSKTDLAKYLNAWDMLPDIVCLGSEKNFARFTYDLREKPIVVDKIFCRELVAKAILFRRTDKIVRELNFGGWKANIVAHTVAKLAYATEQRLDLDRIWRAQDITPATGSALRDLALRVHALLNSPPPGKTNAGEWSKDERAWQRVRDLDWQVPAKLAAELTDQPAQSNDGPDADHLSPPEWRALADWGVRTGKLDEAQRKAAGEIADAYANGYRPAGKHLSQAPSLIAAARAGGFQLSLPQQ